MAVNKETDLILKKISSFDDISLSKKKSIEPNRYTNDTALKLILEHLDSNWLVDVIGYFNNSRSKSDYKVIDNEYKVQDLIYCQPRSIISDLQYEDPNSKTVGSLTSTRIDFVSKSKRIFIEVKHASNKHKAKKIESEISEDIIKYGKTGNFDDLIFFIYCNNYSFPNKREFENGFTGSQSIFNNRIHTICIIKP